MPLVPGSTQPLVGNLVVTVLSPGYDDELPSEQASLRLLDIILRAFMSKKFPKEHVCPQELIFMGMRPTGRAVVFDCMRRVT